MSIDSSQVAQSNMSEWSAVQASERCITPTCCIGGVEINKMAVNKNNWNSCSSTACNCTSVNVQPLPRHIVCRRKRRVLDWMKLMPIYWPFNSFTVHNYYCAIRLLSEPTWLASYEYLARGGQNSLLILFILWLKVTLIGSTPSSHDRNNNNNMTEWQGLVSCGFLLTLSHIHLEPY